MSNRTIDIKIKATGDSAAVDRTSKSLDTLDKSQQSANKSGTASKAASLSAGQGFSALGQAASATASGGIGPLSSALGNLTQQIPALAGAAGPIGLAIGAFTAWAAAIKAVADNADQLQANIANIQAGNAESATKRLTQSYKDLTDQLSEASAEINRFFNAESAGDDAIKRAELAKLELAAAQSRAKLDRSDKFAGPRLELDIAQKKAAIEDAAAARASAREKQAIAAQMEIERARMAAAGEQQGALAERAAGLMGQQQSVTARASEKASAWYRTPGGKEEIWQDAGKELARIATQLESIKNEMAGTIKTQSAAGGNLASLSTARDINALSSSTRGTTQQAASIGYRNTAADINYQQREQINAARIAAERKRDAITSRRSELQSSSLKEQDDLRSARNFGGSDEQIKKELEEAKKALEAVREYSRENAATLSKLNAEISKAREAIRNLPRN